MNSVLLTSIACSLLLLPYSEGIKCYSCLASPPLNARSGNPNFPFPTPNAQCNDYPSSALVDCGSSANTCHSIILDINADGLDNKLSYALKTCGNDQTTTYCNALGTRSATIKGSCYSCSKDGCNSAMSAALNISLLATAAAIFKLFH